MGERILDLLRQGFSYNAIVTEVGCSKSTINYYAKKLGTATSLRRYDWQDVQAYHDQGNTTSQCRSTSATARTPGTRPSSVVQLRHAPGRSQ